MSSLRTADPEIYEVIRKETERQAFGLELIPSENFVSEAVLEATGSVLTNKYAEGYPGKRYYGGCEFVDQAEELAIERAKKLFGAEHANVQPHSGSQANMAVYLAVKNPGDTILGMNLSHGGHLTHGSPVNFSGKLFQGVAYGVRPTPVPYGEFWTTTPHKTLRGPRAGMILCRAEMAKKLNSSIFPGIQGGPLMHVIAAKAVAFQEAMTPEWREYQARIVRNAKALAATLADRGVRRAPRGAEHH